MATKKNFEKFNKGVAKITTEIHAFGPISTDNGDQVAVCGR